MPIYEFSCPACGVDFDELVGSGEIPGCPRCGFASPRKRMSLTAAPARSTAQLARVRAAAAREGHFSHYSPAERRKASHGGS